MQRHEQRWYKGFIGNTPNKFTVLKNLTAHERIILIYISSWEYKEDMYLSVRYIAEQTGFGKATVERSLAKLIRLKYIRVRSKGDKAKGIPHGYETTFDIEYKATPKPVLTERTGCPQAEDGVSSQRGRGVLTERTIQKEENKKIKKESVAPPLKNGGSASPGQKIGLKPMAPYHMENPPEPFVPEILDAENLIVVRVKPKSVRETYFSIKCG